MSNPKDFLDEIIAERGPDFPAKVAEAHWSAKLVALLPHRETVEELLRQARAEERERCVSAVGCIYDTDARSMRDEVVRTLQELGDPGSFWPKVTP